MFKPLRDKILKLAISGKLVPQLDSEPTVEQIGPAPAKDEEPFALPEKWKWVQIGNLLPFGKNATQVDPSKIPSNAWVLGLEDIESNGGLISKNRNALVSSSKNAFNAGNVLYSKMRPYLNKAIIADEDGYCTTEIFVLDVLKAVLPLDAEYLLYFLRSPYFVSYAIKSSKGQKPRLDTKLGQKALFPLPPIEEQRRIVSKLDDIMGNLERMDQAYTELSGPMAKHFKNLVLQQAISGQLVPQLDSEPAVEQIGLAPAKEEEPFALPEKWKWVRLDQVAQYRPSVKADDELEVSFAPLEKLSDGYDNFFCFDLIERWSKVKKGFSRFCNGDVIFAKIHPSFQNRKSAVVTRAHNGIGCGSTEYCVFRCKEPLDNQYLLWFFKSEYFISFGKNTFKGTVGQQRVNLDVITTMLFTLPPLGEQRRIVARIEELFGDVDKLLEWQQFA